MDMFVFALGFLILACILIHLYTRQVQQPVKDSNYRSFQQNYLIVYLLAVGKNSMKKINNSSSINDIYVFLFSSW